MKNGIKNSKEKDSLNEETKIRKKRSKNYKKQGAYRCAYCPAQFKWRSDCYRHKRNKGCIVGEELGYLKWIVVKQIIENYKQRVKIREANANRGLIFEYNEEGEEMTCKKSRWQQYLKFSS